MDIKQLEYFIKVCDCGSFTQAAQKNYISPQGINSAILRLEKELGKQLLVRFNNGVKPTADGEYLYKKAYQIIVMVKDCENHFHTELTKTQIIGISLTTDILAALPSEAYTLIINKYGMSTRTEGGYTCEHDLTSGLSSFALVEGPPFNPKLSYQHCFKRERILIVNRKNPLLDEKNLLLANLENERFILPDTTYKVYGDFTNICMEYLFVPEIEVHVNSLSQTYEVLKQRPDLIGVSFDYYYRQNYDPEIVELPLKNFYWPYNLYLAYCKNATFSEAEKNFLSDFLGCFSKERHIM